MPALTDSPNPFVKALVIGDSGAGKTGALGSLIQAGYRVSILDYDNKVQSGFLPQFLKKNCPDHLGLVDFEVVRDKFKTGPLGTPVLDGMPTAFKTGLALCDKWSDGTLPRKWGPDRVLVVDSLTFMSDSAYNQAQAMSPATKDPRQWFYTAQQWVENFIAMLTAKDFETHVLILAHISYQKNADGTEKGWPASVGKALGPTIPAYFDNMSLCQSMAAGKRSIKTIATPILDLKNPAGIAKTLPIESGMAEIFRELRT